MNPDRSERHSNSFKVFMIPVFRDYVSAGSYCFLVEDITSKREKKTQSFSVRYGLLYKSVRASIFHSQVKL